MYTKHYQHKHHHIFQYSILFLLLITGFFAFTRLTGHRHEQIKIATLTGLAYAVWGCFHHLYDQDLSWKVMIEYVSLALLGSVLLWLLLIYIG